MEIEIKKSKSYPIVIQRKRMKRMILRYRDGRYYLSVPQEMPLSMIKTWLESLDESKLEKLQLAMKIKRTEDFVYLFGKKYLLCHYAVGENRVTVRNHRIYVYGNHLNQCLDKFLKETLYQYIYERIAYYLAEGLIDFMPTIQIQPMKSRYGVCFYQDRRVKFSTNLVHEPCQVIDSIIIHELGHFYYPCHSADFYHWIDRYDKSYALHEAFLKKGGAGDDPVDKE